MKKLSFAALFVLGVPLGSHAQLTPAERTDVIAGTLARTADPTGRSPLQTAPVFSLEGTTTDKLATAQIGFQLADLTMKFGLKAPLDTSSDMTLFADLNGLRNKSTATLSGTWSFFDVADPGPVLIAACDEYAAETGTAIVPCTLLGLRRSDDPIARAAGRRVRARIDPGVVYFAGAELSVSPDKYNFVAGPAFTAMSESHTSWSAAVSAGMLTRHAIWLSGHYTHAVAYQGAPETEVCSPLTGTLSLQCGKRVLRAPFRQASEIIGGEVRKFFNSRFAITARLNHDLKDDVTGLEVPLYFVRNSDGGLTGGISIGWRSDTDAVIASAFVGQVLALIR